MSDPRAKAERSRAKDLRQGIEGDYHRPKPKKKAKPNKPFRVMVELPFFLGDKPLCIHRAATREQAEAWIEKESRSYFGKRRGYWIEGEE